MDYVGPMPVQMNIAEAKAKLSSLVQKALDGEEVIIARDGVPAVRIVAVEADQKPKRQFGLLRTKYGYEGDLPYEAFEPHPWDAEVSSDLDDLIDSPMEGGLTKPQAEKAQ